ncbi:MAG: hypothetical protein IJO08_01150 [Clostridia bacterium]|nr:hypothetical protein [Clostridia bacterium]
MRRHSFEIRLIASVIGIFGIFIMCILMICRDISNREIVEENATTENVNIEVETVNHTHDWKEIAIEASAIIETKELQAVASEGVPVVYLTRYRSDQNGSSKDKYMAYDSEFNDVIISASMPNARIEVEYITEGTPRLEVYEHSKPICSICQAKLVSYQLRTYKFLIPEGTLLIHWE